MRSSTLLSSRDLGVFPISIGTSLAIEALANLTPDRDPVFPLGINRIDTIMVNIRTLIRNVESSFKNDEVKKLLVEDLADVVQTDMAGIVAAVNEISDGRVKVVFYRCSYSSLGKLKYANLVKPTTPGQQLRHDKTGAVIMRLDKMSGDRSGHPVKLYDLYPDEIGHTSDRVAMLTHFPMDLVHYKRFNELLLLESNTGRLKGKEDFYTKLHKKVDDLKLPLNMFTLQVFGDGKIFRPMNSEIVNEVIDVARRGKWTYMTTHDKIYHWLDQIKLRGHIQSLKEMARN